jgi:hypothetical protein
LINFCTADTPPTRQVIRATGASEVKALARSPSWDVAPHAFDQHFDVARMVTGEARIEAFSESIVAPPHTRDMAGRVLAAVKDAQARLLVVHPDSFLDEKSMRPAQLRSALEAFLAARPEFVCMVVGLWSPEQAAIEGDRIVWATSLTLGIAAELIGNADLFLGVDSCMLHVADLARVPSVALFGPSEPHVWGLRFTRGVTLEGGEAVQRIPPEAISSALIHLWEGQQDSGRGSTAVTNHPLSAQAS